MKAQKLPRWLNYLSRAFIILGVFLILSLGFSMLRVFVSPFHYIESPYFNERGIAGLILLMVGTLMREIGANGLSGIRKALRSDKARKPVGPGRQSPQSAMRDAHSDCEANKNAE
jgi:hypothetical protein